MTTDRLQTAINRILNDHAVLVMSGHEPALVQLTEDSIEIAERAFPNDLDVKQHVVRQVIDHSIKLVMKCRQSPEDAKSRRIADELSSSLDDVMSAFDYYIDTKAT